jgi:hypothetical protein
MKEPAEVLGVASEREKDEYAEELVEEEPGGGGTAEEAAEEDHGEGGVRVSEDEEHEGRSSPEHSSTSPSTILSCVKHGRMDFEEAGVALKVVSRDEGTDGFKEVMGTVNAAKWRQACGDEYEALRRMWSTIEWPPDASVIGRRHSFGVDRDNPGHFDEFQSRLAIQHHSQTPGVDCYSLAIRLTIMLILIDKLSSITFSDDGNATGDTDSPYIEAIQHRADILTKPPSTYKRLHIPGF